MEKITLLANPNDIVSSFCGKIFAEAHAIEKARFPIIYRDLFSEQGRYYVNFILVRNSQNLNPKSITVFSIFKYRFLSLTMIIIIYFNINIEKLLTQSEFLLKTVTLIQDENSNTVHARMSKTKCKNEIFFISSCMFNVGLPAIFEGILAAQNFIMAK